MSSRSHLRLRIGAIALLAALAVWPRAKSGLAKAELARAQERATHGVDVSARRLSAPRTTKLVVADNDESHLTN